MRNISITVLALLVTAGCNRSKPITQAPQAVQVQQVEATKTAAAALRFSAVVEPDAQVPLSFRIPGYVVSLKQVRGQDGRMRDIDEGDRVTRGAVLVHIRAAEYQDKVHQASSQTAAAQAVLQRAQFDYDRANRLYATQSMTKPDYDAATSQYQAAQAEVKAAQAQTSEAQVALRDTVLPAPFDGDIIKKSVELGAFVGPGAPLFELAKTNYMKIVIGVPDTVVRSIKLGAPMDVTVDAFGDRPFRAHISRINSAADPKTRNFEVEISIPNRDRALKAGMIASVQFSPTQSHPTPSLKSYQLPLSAIVQVPNGGYGVFVTSTSGSDTVARLTPITVGAVNGTDINVVSGVTTGDVVVTAGANLLKDGQRVEVVK
ncbi:MAG: efflux RND transporter periplasmic adaptor subunit [Acidobacteriales bacterium]|nr:efflux RND transporter periplasmic adaptor subunit [Terriglobales bacterium]